MSEAKTRADAKNRRVLWIGDAVASTGFARCTHAVCDYLHGASWDVHVLGLNHYGDPHKYPYTIYPAYQPLAGGVDYAGVSRVADLCARISPDIVVVLNDPWNVSAYAERVPAGIPVVPWLAVDSANVHLDARFPLTIVWTQFAANELRRTGYRGDLKIVPLGFDHIEPVQCSKQESRKLLLGELKCASETIRKDLVGELESNLDNAFIFGYVGRNQPRKRLDLLLRYFALYREKMIDEGGANAAIAERSYLYLHTAPTGEYSTSLSSLMKYYRLEGHILCSHGGLGAGLGDDVLSHTYNMLDAFITTSQAEGWCLPVGEAMLHGVPCIVPDCSALNSSTGWTSDGAYQIPCTSSALTAPINAAAYTIGAIMDEDGAVQAMYDLATHDDLPSSYIGQRGREVASSYRWADIGPRMETILARVIHQNLEQQWNESRG